jgi:ADP-ribose pyrophosphatase YjhB (NUDIX family)
MFSRLAALARQRPVLTTVASMAPIVGVSQLAGSNEASTPAANRAGEPGKEHHKAGGGFVNPWESFQVRPVQPGEGGDERVEREIEEEEEPVEGFVDDGTAY